MTFSPSSSTLSDGKSTFSATFTSAGSWTVTATDSVYPQITGTSNQIRVA